MTHSTLTKLLVVLCGLALTLSVFSGCQGGFPSIPGEELINGGGATPSPIPTPTPASQATTSVLKVTSPAKDVTCAVGQPVLISWTIDSLPNNPVVDILYRSTTDAADKVLISDLFTSNVGSCQIDTYSFIPGLSYYITLRLKSNGQTIVTTKASGRVIVAIPSMTINTPSSDTSALPSQIVKINWSGKYLPSGGTLDAFLDIDETYNSGNEIVLQSSSLNTTGAQLYGSVPLQMSDLWDNAKVKRGISYYVGLRVVKNGRTYLGAYAPATLTLYNGQGFNILTQTLDTVVHFGDYLQVKWTTNGVPSALKVHITLIDTLDGTEIDAPQEYQVTDGSARFLTYSLVPTRSYDIVCKLFENDTLITVRKANGSVTVNTAGSSIYITNPELQTSIGRVLIGLGSSFDITWVTVQPPVDSMVKLLLDEDGDLLTTADQQEITPSGGLDEGLNHFLFEPTIANFTLPTAHEYYVVAQLLAKDALFSQSQSIGKIRVGPGGIIVTAPATDISTTLGSDVTARWTFTGNILASYPGKKKIIRLYASEQPVFDNTTAIQLTDNVTGLDVTAGLTSFTFNTQVLSDGKSYYIIGRLFIEGSTQEEARSVSVGRIVIPGVAINVLTPAVDVTDNLTEVTVSWEITGLDVTNRFMRILATDGAKVVVIKSKFVASTPGLTIVDASKLPPGAHTLRCLIFEYDELGNEIIRATGDSLGSVIIPDWYNGSYDLSDMAAVKTSNYSPLDGIIFEGFNIGEGAGYELASVGDLNSDNLSDILIFSRYGNQYTTGNSGVGYLIYGRSSYSQPVISLNSVLSPSPNTRPVDGSILLFPIENMADLNLYGEIFGKYSALGTPDVSDDGKGDLLIACPEAAPLMFHFNNLTDSPTTITDHYGNSRTLPKAGDFVPGNGYEPAHVPMQFQLVGPYGDGTIRPVFYYGSPQDDYHFLPGDTINVTIVGIDSKKYMEVTIDHARQKRGAAYLLTSQRLAKYMNGVYDLNKVGSPVEDMDGAETALTMPVGLYTQQWTTAKKERSSMIMWHSPDRSHGFGESISVMPDVDGAGGPELLISIPKCYALNMAQPDWETAAPRVEAGLVKFLGLEYRITSLQTGLGLIGWEWPQWITLLPYNGTPHNTDGYTSRLDIIGSGDNATLTGVAGLGRFASMTDHSVYTSGDFNGDSVPDFVVGSPGEYNGMGSIYVVPVRPIFGRRVPNIDLANFNRSLPPGYDPSLEVPVLGVKIIGTDTSMKLGTNIKPAGDFNGDGLADLLIGMPGYNGGKGRVIIMFGQNGLIGNFTADQLDSHLGTQLPALVFDGEAAGDHFGQRVTAIYDVNGDGVDDILIAAPDAGVPWKSGCGKAYLVFGRKNIIKNDASNNNYLYVDYIRDGKGDDYISAADLGKTITGAVFNGEAANVHLQAVSVAGDVNGDGVGDFILGSPFTDVSAVQEKAGKAYLIFGRKFDLVN